MWPTHYLPLKNREDGIPPPRLTLTTPPYPTEVIEEFKSSGTVEAVAFGIGAEEEISSFAALIGGTINERLISFNAGIDEIESTALLIGGTLITRLKTYNAGRDEIESHAALISGTLRDPLVVYENWPLLPDELASSGALIGGVLT